MLAAIAPAVPAAPCVRVHDVRCSRNCRMICCDPNRARAQFVSPPPSLMHGGAPCTDFRGVPDISIETTMAVSTGQLATRSCADLEIAGPGADDHRCAVAASARRRSNRRSGPRPKPCDPTVRSQCGGPTCSRQHEFLSASPGHRRHQPRETRCFAPVPYAAGRSSVTNEVAFWLDRTGLPPLLFPAGIALQERGDRVDVLFGELRQRPATA